MPGSPLPWPGSPPFAWSPLLALPWVLGLALVVHGWGSLPVWGLTCQPLHFLPCGLGVLHLAWLTSLAQLTPHAWLTPSLAWLTSLAWLNPLAGWGCSALRALGLPLALWGLLIHGLFVAHWALHMATSTSLADALHFLGWGLGRWYSFLEHSNLLAALAGPLH